jgi:ribosomal protein S12 methylthiotransferase accessory factor
MWNFSPIANYPKVSEKPDWAERLLKDSGIVEDYKRLTRYYDEPFLYSYAAQIKSKDSQPSQSRREDAGGFSFDHSVSLMKAAGEAAERFSLERVNHLHFSSGRFSDESPSLSPNEFRFFSKEQLSTDDFKCFDWNNEARFLWTPGKNLLTGMDVNLPAQLVYLHLSPHAQKSEPALFPVTSTGAACGQTAEESCLSAMLELLERDAFMVHYLSRTNGTRIDISSSPVLSEVEDYLRRFRLSLSAYWLGTDFPVCPVLALITDVFQDGSPSPWLAAGLKCSFDPTRSILGAIEEACQVRIYMRSLLERMFINGGTLPSEMTTDVISDRALYWNRPERVKDIEFLTTSKKVIPFGEIPSYAGSSPKQTLDTLLNFCSNSGHSVYASDVTAPEVQAHGLTVTRAIMPTLQQFYLAEPFVPLASSRWQTVPYRLGLCDQKAQEPNRIPHFFL